MGVSIDDIVGSVLPAGGEPRRKVVGKVKVRTYCKSTYLGVKWIYMDDNAFEV